MQVKVGRYQVAILLFSNFVKSVILKQSSSFATKAFSYFVYALEMTDLHAFGNI